VASTYTNQSADLGDILDAVALLARKALGWGSDRVVEYHFDRRPNLDEGRSLVWYQLVEREPDRDSGALRHGTKTKVTVDIRLVTRGFQDRADRDRKVGRAHWANQYLLENAFYGHMLFDAYEDREVDSVLGVDEPPKPPADGTATVLSAGGAMTMGPIPAARKPRPEQGYMETQLVVDIPCILRLTLNSVPDLDE
jgi:hypothetical protein